MKTNQKGFSAVEVIIVLVVIGLLGGVGWFVWQSRNHNPINKPVQSSQSSTTQNTQSDRQTSYLTLTDFKARIPLDDKTMGLRLGSTSSSSYNEADKSVPIIASSLDSAWTCEADSDGNFKGSIGTISITNQTKRSGPGEPLITKKVGSYTFGFEQGGANCTDSPEYRQLVEAFKTQFEKIEAN